MKTKRTTALALALALVLGNFLLLGASASAASLTNTSVRLNRMSTGTATSFRLVFKATTGGANPVSVNFNGGDTSTWTGASGVVNATQTVSSAACAADTGATALPGSLTAAGSGSTVTVSGVTALTAGANYCVDLTSASAVTTPTAAGEYHPVVTNGADSVTIALRVVSNDQIVVTASVAPTFNFVLSGNTDNFTTILGAGTVATTSGITATVNTNAKTGWVAWVKDLNTGLNSAAASKTIASTTPGTSATLAAGTEGYTLGITNITQGSGAGSTVAVPAYDATGAAHGSGLDTTYRQLASSNGTANNAVLTLKERAAINALTPAASDYTDTVTVIGAGNF